MRHQDSVAPELGETERKGIDWEHLEWSCHFCEEMRPDELIGVAAATRMFGTVEVRMTRRYCLDRTACVEAAETWQEEAKLP